MKQQEFSEQALAMLACPVCHGRLSGENGQIVCGMCGRRYPIEDGIPILLADRAQQP